MTDRIEIQPVGPLEASVRPPGSKSMTNRALVCAALAEGRSTLEGALASDDTRVMIEALRTLGIDVVVADGGDRVTVLGCGGILPRDGADLKVGNSGTTVRFLAALVTLGQGTFRLDGVERMRQRPIEDLLAALRQLGADAKSEHGTDCPPVLVRGHGLKGGAATVRGDISSQFLSGLLMIAPYAQQPVELRVDGPLVSRPYVAMTLAVMKAFGVRVEPDALTRFQIPTARYSARRYAIEPDASAASYFFAAAAIAGGQARVEGLSRESLQGDVAFCDCLERMGCEVRYAADHITVVARPLRGIEVNMNGISDTVQTLAAVALFAEGATTISGVGHIRHKETDRIGDLATELRKLGAEVHERPDGLTIVPGPWRAAEIDTYDDHRMAMSLALVGLRMPGIVIKDPACTQKTYPRFFQDLAALEQG